MSATTTSRPDFIAWAKDHAPWLRDLSHYPDEPGFFHPETNRSWLAWCGASEARPHEIVDVVDVLCAARKLAADARRFGVVLTIKQRPLQPLAMGHHEDVIELREVRQ